MTSVPFFLLDCREIVADLTSMSSVFGALDFDAFIAGYCEYAAWRSTRGEESRRIPTVTSKGELRQRASYAA